MGRITPPRRGPFVESVQLVRDEACDLEAYPFNLPTIRALTSLELHPSVTFFVGENGSGKSTLLEAMAVVAGFNAEGGTKSFRFATRSSESSLHRALRFRRTYVRETRGFFLRAESFYNVATEVEELGVGEYYGPRPLHEQSHGESFLALIEHRFGPGGLYMMDEPEAALSPTRQIAVLKRIHASIEAGSQYVIATHSPIFLAYPNSRIYEFSDQGILETRYEATDAYRVTRSFMDNRERFFAQLFAESRGDSDAET